MKGDRTAELENGQHLRGLLLPGSDERTARESGNTVRNRRGSGTHAGSMDEIQMLPEETDGEYTKMAGEMTSLEGMQEDEANEDDDEDADDDM